jgi:hypothetical protein
VCKRLHRSLSRICGGVTNAAVLFLMILTTLAAVGKGFAVVVLPTLAAVAKGLQW